LNSIYKPISYIQEELDLRILIPDRLIEKMRKMVTKHFPNEFGGIFVGYYSDNKKEAKIEDVLWPNQFINSPQTFIRVPNDINAALKRMYNESNGRLIYLGEWHSHPLGPDSFSILDFEAIKSIAQDKKIKIDLPLLCICFCHREKNNFRFYVYHENQLFNFEKE